MKIENTNKLFPLTNVQSSQSQLVLEAAEGLRYDSGREGEAYKMVAWTVINGQDLSVEVQFPKAPEIPDEVANNILASYALHELVFKYYVEQNN